MMAEERRIVREEASNWWILLVSGIAWLLIAWIVLRLDVTSVATVGVLIGAVFVVAAVNEVTVASLVPGGWKIWHYVMAFIFFLGGLWALITPIETFFALASVLGLILVFYGVFEIARAVSTRATNPYWWVGLITGVPSPPPGVLGVRIRPRVRVGSTGVPDLVLGGSLRAVQGHHADHARVRGSTRGEGGRRRLRDGVGERIGPSLLRRHVEAGKRAHQRCTK